MKKILFLLDELPPTKSANGICVNKIIQELHKDGYEASCICWKAPAQYPAEVHLIPEKPWKQKVDKYGSGGPLARVWLQVLRIAYKIKRVFLIPIWPVDSCKTVRDFYKTAAALIDQDKVSVVVAVNYPGETLLAMKRLKKRYKSRIQAVMYPLDVSYVNPYCGTLERRMSVFFCPKFMRSCSRYADVLFVLENAQDVYNEVYSEKERANFKICGIPLLETVAAKENHSTTGEIHCVYSGTLQRNIRDPEIAFTTLDKIAQKIDSKIIFDLYGQEDRATRELYNNGEYAFEFVNHGWIQESELESCLQKADVLISLGNMECHLIPSKLFKYMAIKKPIVHLCFTKKDPCIQYLKKYGNAKVIFSSDITEDKRLNELVQFITRASLADINLQEYFPRCFPNYTARLIEDLTKI